MTAVNHRCKGRMLRVIVGKRRDAANIAGAGHRRHDGAAPTAREKLRRRPVDPKGALAMKLIKAKRIGGAGITPCHIAKEFGEFRPHIGFLDLLSFEHIPVEILIN